ncbi:MAG: UTP--glucose-1-phosphate uridylyltransferase GalU [Gammaproteobacteria bacterium]|nr:UTP--glucose-1-phosphate uridylyltransferase GalU [Gammaproteobacteria bacterium]
MVKPLRKAVIPVAGLGTRFLPATKAIPKEMLPVVDKPLIQYIVEEASEAGITDLILVTHSDKSAIENHFDKRYELESELIRRGKTDLLEIKRGTTPENIRIISVRQPEALGLGHAVLCAEPAIGDEPFAVLLPDVLMYHPHKGCLKQMVDSYNRTHTSIIALTEVAMDEVEKYGIADVEGSDLRIAGMVEKPKPEDAPSNLSIVGRYIFTPRIMEILKQTKKGAGGEIQLTDAMAELLRYEVMFGFTFDGVSYDCGDKQGFLQANVEYALRDKALGKEFREWLKLFASSL